MLFYYYFSAARETEWYGALHETGVNSFRAPSAEVTGVVVRENAGPGASPERRPPASHSVRSSGLLDRDASWRPRQGEVSLQEATTCS
jgi:hypothetical protein